MNLNFDKCYYLFFQQTDLESGEATSPDSAATATSSASQGSSVGPKRLHVSNIPFRFREADLKSLLGVGIKNKC